MAWSRTAPCDIDGERIAWVGPDAGAARELSKLAERQDLGGRLVTPALIDCHTHLVLGGDRAREFEMRLEGASYEEIARAGGGIVSTVRRHARREARRRCSPSALPRVDALIAEGVATSRSSPATGSTARPS